MNKIKIIYDVVRKMKDKDVLKGTFKAAGMKDQEKMFSISNTFERSSKDGHIHSAHNHQHGVHAGGFKEGLNRISCVLGILGSIKLEEKEDKSVVMSLESADIPEEIRGCIQEMMKRGHEHHQNMAENHQHHMFMKELHGMEKTDFALKIFINKDKEVEIATISISGEKQDEENERHDIIMSAELHLEQ